ncbi:Protein lifeguard 2 [Bagarius yarrelli]|uniref:Protein lifeguard 2 n=1 Tax=Bagarius yarrelli TaxID=175774 RepID=A0A556U0J9_BAGYA|nr:Protein lifeguard 2 [Bagarius yarrelli]
MTQGKLLAVNKSNESSAQPPQPPSYQEATEVWLFSDLTVGYVQVYAILTLQLSVTLAIVSFFTFCAVFLVTYLTLSCCVQPSYYNTKSVMICLGITVLVCLTVSLFSFQTKIDVTSCQGVLFVTCTSFFICGLVLAFVIPLGNVPWLHTVFAGLGAVLFSMFLAFDTQLLIGKKRYNISPEEYIFATLNIYLDIVYIFSFFLQIFGSQKEYSKKKWLKPLFGMFKRKGCHVTRCSADDWAKHVRAYYRRDRKPANGNASCKDADFGHVVVLNEEEAGEVTV